MFKYPDFTKFLTEEFLLKFFGKIGLAIAAVFVGLIVVRYIDKVAQNIMTRVIDLRLLAATQEERQRAEVRRQTLSSIAHHALVIAGYLIITLMALDIVGLDIRPILATAGVASLAVGFGAQNLVKDVISGFFIILEDQYGKGDFVNLDGDSGFVEQLGLRTTHLRNGEGTLIVKTNGSINVVRNFTKDWAGIDFRIGVSYSTDIARALKILEEVGMNLKKDHSSLILNNPEILGVESFNESDVTLRMSIKSVPHQQWQLKRELNKRVKERFDREGIEIPFPQRTVWTKST